MLEKLFEKKKLREAKVQKARQDFTSWQEISISQGWKIYEEKVEQKIDIIKSQIENDLTLTSEDLKRLQLALQVWKQVQRIPKELQDNAKAGGK